MLTDVIRRLIYRSSWDTRCRGVDAARILKPMMDGETKVLDAGCGEYGLAAFIPSGQITGVDILPEQDIRSSVEYFKGSVVDLPFEKETFDIAASIDVLEH